MIIFEELFRIRYGECDAQGVVYNANYMAYCDHAFDAFLRKTFGNYFRKVEIATQRLTTNECSL